MYNVKTLKTHASHAVKSLRKVAKLLPPTKAVADMLEFQGHVIVARTPAMLLAMLSQQLLQLLPENRPEAYSEGQLRIFDAEGTLKSETSLDAGPILKLAARIRQKRMCTSRGHEDMGSARKM